MAENNTVDDVIKNMVGKCLLILPCFPVLPHS